MALSGKKEAIMLLFGDILIFLFSLWLTLVIRFFELPSAGLWNEHIYPFSILFIAWIAIFVIVGLYRNQTTMIKRKLPVTIMRAQVTNMLLAATFFFLIPYFEIAPKTNLFIYLVVSSVLIVVWRLLLSPLLSIRKKRIGILVGSGGEILELEEEVNSNPRYNLQIIKTLNLDELSSDMIVSETETAIKENNVSVIAIDGSDERVVPILPVLYSLIFVGAQIVDIGRMYEDIFDRVPLSFVKQNWLLDNVTLSSKIIHDSIKRLLDIGVGLFVGMVSLVVYPFVYIAVTLDDRGSIFYFQERIGKNGKVVRFAKFRTMTTDGSEQITKVGNFLRASRIDELPQLWSVLKGDLSLIGPRPEKPDYVALYENRIPYYNTRHLIKPGLSGWAQIHQENPPKFGVQYDETAMKLSYDLYYVKHRSIVLDLQIALQTIRTILSRSGV